MNTRAGSLMAGLIIILISGWFCPPAAAKLISLTTDNAGHFSITAKKQDVTIAGQTIHAMIYEDDNNKLNGATFPDGIPVLVMRLNVGQMVTCKFTNKLPAGEVMEGATIHWHGIELDNDSDGTAVTQDTVKENQTYTYRFVVSRPGIFWFHSHMVPGDTLFAGMYGVIIVQSACEAEIIRTNALPSANATFNLAMTDIEWDTRQMVNGMANPTFGTVGKVDGAGKFQVINKWIEDCATARGQAVCQIASFPGNTVLVNGFNPDQTPAPLTFGVRSGQMIRLRLLNEALTRTFNLKLIAPGNVQVNLLRIGGQGGLLNNARLEGGNGLKGAATDKGWDSLYDKGAIVISSGMRSDVVATIPANLAPGTIVTLTGNPLPGAQWPLMANITAPYPIAKFQVVAGQPPPNPPIADGSPILAGRCDPVMNLTNGNVTITNFITPAPFGGSSDSRIRLTQANAQPSIDNLSLLPAAGGNPLDGNAGDGSVWQTKRLSTSRYAHVGDLLQLSVRNETGGNSGVAHPYHLHGFSFQPVAILDDATGNTKFTFNYNEFLDTIDVYSTETLLFSVLLEDRARFCDQSSGSPPNSGPVLGPCISAAKGGALGRWVYHCHIAAHGVLGMMGEIVVIEDTPQQQVWLQQPDKTTNGVDVLATQGTGSQTVADDFLWTGGAKPVTRVTVWGSWTNDAVDLDAMFELKFWTDVPASKTTPSRPGWQAWRLLFPAGTYRTNLEATVPYEGFYDPSKPSFLAQGDTKVFRYDFDIPQSMAFSPRAGNTNWVSVTAYTTCPCSLFGWKTSVLTNGWNDDGTWSSTLLGPHWTELRYPPGHPYNPKSMNMAFALSAPAPGSAAHSALSTPPLLSVPLSNGQIQISWPGEGILQYSDKLNGSWTTIEGATSPYLTSPESVHRYYRLLVQ